LFDEAFVVITGGRSRWARDRKLKLSDLIEAPWVLPPYDSVPGAFMVEAFRANKLQPPEPRLVTLSVHLTTTLIATGRFVGFVPASVVRFGGQRAGLKTLPINLPNQRIAADIITVKNRSLNPLARLFIDCAVEVVKPLTGAP
jgi:DNA-binding transcriptional LysR family regulator